MLKGQAKMDEFTFVLLAGVVLILVLMLSWTAPTEAPPTVEPTSISLDIAKGRTDSFDISITGKLTNITLSASAEIKNWITFSKNNFDSTDTTTVKVTVKVPSTALTGTRTGTIKVSSTGGEKTISVTINVQEIPTALYSRPIFLGDFSVRYSYGSDVLDSKENVRASTGYFSSTYFNLLGSLTEDKLSITQDGYIQLIVDETNSAGNLIVLFNGQEVFNQKVGHGELLIPIEKSLIKKSNTITVKAGSPGWMFWMETVYKFRVAKFAINYEGIFSKEIPFELSQTEASNFNKFQLTYRVGEYTSPLPELIIKINSQIVYMQQPPLAFFNSNFTEDILGNNLYTRPGDNVISFAFERTATYKISDAILTVFYTS